MKESLEDKKREKNHLEQLVDSDIKSMNFKTDAHLKYLKFIGGTVFLGFFYMWCSSNKDSNFFMMLNKNIVFLHVFALIPYILLLFFLYFVLKSAKAIKGKIDLTFYQEYSFQKEIFGKFLFLKMGLDENVDIIKAMEKYKKCEKDIKFEYYDFRDYVKTFIEKRYKFDYPELFFEHFSKLILYNEEINGTLIKENKIDYTFIVEKNIDFLMHL